MDIPGSKPVAPVATALQSTTDSVSKTATDALTSAAVKPVVATAAAPSPAQWLQQDMKDQAAAIAAQLQDFLQSSRRDVEFRVDADTHTQIVTVRDATTGDVIRQMPSVEALRVLKSLNAAQGTLLDHIA